MLIEIHGDVWLLSDIVCISLTEEEIAIKLRGWDEDSWECYEMDSREQAEGTHLALVAEWKKWLGC